MSDIHRCLIPFLLNRSLFPQHDLFGRRYFRILDKLISVSLAVLFAIMNVKSTIRTKSELVSSLYLAYRRAFIIFMAFRTPMRYIIMFWICKKKLYDAEIDLEDFYGRISDADTHADSLNISHEPQSFFSQVDVAESIILLHEHVEPKTFAQTVHPILNEFHKEWHGATNREVKSLIASNI
jgi:hypothetical protein